MIPYFLFIFSAIYRTYHFKWCKPRIIYRNIIVSALIGKLNGIWRIVILFIVYDQIFNTVYCKLFLFWSPKLKSSPGLMQLPQAEEKPNQSRSFPLGTPPSLAVIQKINLLRVFVLIGTFKSLSSYSF